MIRRSSVIPVMVHPRAGPYVLLGRNRASEGWTGASCWSDFGGNVAAGESVEQAAAREIAEETIETLVKHHEAKIFQTSLEEQNYMFKFQDQFNVVFAVKFAWDPAKTHEFLVLRKILASIAKLARGIPLTTGDQASLCKYRWFCKDKRLCDLLLHPAIHAEEQAVACQTLVCAQQRLSRELGIRWGSSSSASAQGHLMKAHVVRRVDDAWLEKDELHLFSLPQIREMLSRDSITCRGSNCSKLEPRVVPWLQHLSRLFCFQAVCGILQPAAEAEEDADARAEEADATI